MVGKSPEIIEMEASRLEELLARAESNTLRPEDYPTIATLVKSYTSLIDLLQDKSTSLARLRKLLFGASTEKLRDLFPDAPPLPPGAEPPGLAEQRPPENHDDSASDLPAPGSDERKKKEKRARAKRRLQVQRFQASRCRS